MPSTNPPPAPLRHQVARLLTALRAVSLTLIGSGVAVGATLHPGAGLALVALVPASVLLVLAVETLWSRRAGLDDPHPPPSLHRQIGALWGELRATTARFLIDQPASRAPDRHLAPHHQGRVAWIFVHGYLCNAGFWRGWMAHARREDRPALAVTLEPAFGSIDEAAQGLDAAIREVTAVTGRPVVIVAHSMGGLLVRAGWRAHPRTADRWVAEVITIGTPHQGTELARGAYTLNGRQMAPDSPWLQALAAQEPPARARRFHCIHGDTDHVVFPPRRALLPGATATVIAETAHVAMADHPMTLYAVLAATRRAESSAVVEPIPA